MKNHPYVCHWVDEKSLLITTMTMKMNWKLVKFDSRSSGVWGDSLGLWFPLQSCPGPPSTHTNPPVLQCEVGRCQNLPQSFQGIDASNNELNLLKNCERTQSPQQNIYSIQCTKTEGHWRRDLSFPTKKIKFLFAPSQLSVYYLESRNHHRLVVVSGRDPWSSGPVALRRKRKYQWGPVNHPW